MAKGINRPVRFLFLLFVDNIGPSHLRARRRDTVFELIRQTRQLRDRLTDLVVAKRRRALSIRNSTISSLSNEMARSVVRTEMPISMEPLDISKLRLGIFVPSFARGQGGAEKVAGQLANILARAGASVHIICREPDDRPAAYTVEDSIRFCYLDERDDPKIKELREHHYDLLVCFGMAHFYRLIPHIAGLIGVPFVLQECTNPDHMIRLLHKFGDTRSEKDAYWLRQSVFAHANAIRLTSERYRETIGAHAQQFTYAFYNAFRVPGTWQYDPKKVPGKKFICVGAFKNKNKNGMPALKAFCQFSDANPGWQMVLYGDNNYSGNVASVLKKYPRAAVHDAGVTRNVSTIYGDAHALIIPSFEEGLPNVVVEALSFGVPCIGFTDCQAVAQLIEDEKTGLLVERDNPQALAGALEKISDLTYRQRLSRGARQFAEDNFDFDVWQRNWLKTIRHAAGGLNVEGSPRTAAAYCPDGNKTTAWSELLETYRVIA